MDKDLIFQLMGGLGIFFFGMKTMSEGLKKIAGEQLKNFLHNVTKRPIIGILVGAFVTCLVQSSSATTVMVVGFVNAGLLVLKQAISVVMGANIGTTFTAWLVSSMSIFKISSYALPAIGVGFAIMTFSKGRKNQFLGQIILGFGLLFLGLAFMKDAFAPLKQSDYVKEIFVTFSHNPLWGALIGILFTVLLQSSSATIAIVQVLAFNGVIGFDAAIPLILGGNIGTTITAQLAAIGTNINARRTAMSHTIFNVLGALYMLIFIYFGWFGKFFEMLIPGQITTINIMFYIAVAHTLFNIFNTIVFLPSINLLERASIWLVPHKEDSIDFGTQYLEKHLLDTPTLALEQIHNEVIYMLGISQKAVTQAVECFLHSDYKSTSKVADLETVTDNLQSEITQYIVELSQRNLLFDESKELPVWIHNVNDLERIGDHAQNLSELAKRKIEDHLPFTELATGEIKIIWEHIHNMFEEVRTALKENDTDTAKQILEHENTVNQLQQKFKESHLTRLNDGKCQLHSGFIFLEFIDNLEKVGDRLTNIAQSVIGKMQWELVRQEKGST